MRLGANSLVLRQAAMEAPLASPTHTLGKALEGLKGLANDPRVTSGSPDFQDTIKAFAARAADKMPHDAGANHLVFWEDTLDDYNEFIRQWLPSPTRDHTVAEKKIYDVADQLGKDHLLVHGPISWGPPAAKQFSTADRLFDALKNLKRGVSDSRRAAPGAMGTMAHKIDEFVEMEKEKLYDLMPDISLKRDYKTSLEIKDKLASYFSDPLRAARSMKQAELPDSKNGGFTSFIGQVDSWVKRALGNDPNRVTFGDYAKNAAISNYFENRATQGPATQSANDLVRGVVIPRQFPIVAARQAGRGLKSPGTLEAVLKAEESPLYQGAGKAWRTLNLFNRLPEKVRPNRWQLLNTSTDALNKRDGGQ